MTFIQKSEQEVADIRKRQEAFKKCVDKFFDEAVYAVLNKRTEYQQKCLHPDMIVSMEKDGGGSKRCPECGWWCAWGVYDCNPKPPPPYPHESDVEDLLRGLRLV